MYTTRSAVLVAAHTQLLRINTHRQGTWKKGTSEYVRAPLCVCVYVCVCVCHR